MMRSFRPFPERLSSQATVLDHTSMSPRVSPHTSQARSPAIEQDVARSPHCAAFISLSLGWRMPPGISCAAPARPLKVLCDRQGGLWHREYVAIVSLHMYSAVEVTCIAPTPVRGTISALLHKAGPGIRRRAAIPFASLDDSLARSFKKLGERRTCRRYSRP